MPPISPERWRILSPYLDEALDIAPGERLSWLQSIARRDPTLAGELHALLAEQQIVQQARFLEHAIIDPRLGRVSSLEGQVVGAYRLVSPIGEGGSGSVWLAERCDGRFHGRAAVKLLGLPLIGPAGEERFRREGTILAHLRHPRIAHLIDAGLTPGGQPYLVIEHVDGQSINRYCDAHRLSVDARIRLFLDVLQAVVYAHANLIVHRDLKPANVLVSTDGQVKLLDFGIAKLIEADAAWTDAGVVESGELTRFGNALTPEYAAPEQFVGGRVTTATDVYALGVLLYVLLSGRHPAGEAVHDRAALLRAVAHTEPPRVSDIPAATAGDDGVGARHAVHCGTTPRQLRRTLRGDLDAIVAKALKKDPADRYPSVAALEDDLHRYLSNEPIAARPNSVRYRCVKFVRRHAAGVAAFGAVVVLVTAMTTAYTRRLAVARVLAEREAGKAVKISELLMGLLTSVDPYVAGGRAGEPTVGELLDAGAARVQSELTAEPAVQADMLTLMGRTYRRLGAYDKALPVLEQALALGRQAYGREDVRVAQTLDQLGGALAEKGDYVAGARILDQALGLRRALLGNQHPDVAVSLAELGRVYQDEGLNERAEPLHREALAIRQTVLGGEHRETAVSLSDLASVLRLNGDLSGAEALLRQSLETNRKTRGEAHPNTAMTLHDLALIAASRGDYRSAEAQLRRALDLQKRGLGPRHPVVAMTLHNLAHVLRAMNREDEARTMLQEAVAIARPALGTRHQLVAIYSIDLAAAELAVGHAAAAEPLARDGLRIRTLAPDVVPSRRRTLREDDWNVGAARSLLGAALAALGRYSEAETELLQAGRELQAQPVKSLEQIEATDRRLAALHAAWPQRGQPITQSQRPAR